MEHTGCSSQGAVLGSRLNALRVAFTIALTLCGAPRHELEIAQLIIEMYARGQAVRVPWAWHAVEHVGQPEPFGVIKVPSFVLRRELYHPHHCSTRSFFTLSPSSRHRNFKPVVKFLRSAGCAQHAYYAITVTAQSS